MANFASVFKNLRRRELLTQEELAKKLGISKSAISMYENGNREPDFETLESIADFFNVDMNYLLGNTTSTSYIENEVSPFKLEGIYANLAKEAQEKGVDPEDLRAALDIIEQVKNRN